ncbi:hypothetical protein F4604DRAFT_1692697 [Suillus subluteus]|nr:hypothetical protein F4604DRAFT_1692697 [Suillus subluteus]
MPEVRAKDSVRLITVLYRLGQVTRGSVTVHLPLSDVLSATLGRSFWTHAGTSEFCRTSSADTKTRLARCAVLPVLDLLMYHDHPSDVFDERPPKRPRLGAENVALCPATPAHPPIPDGLITMDPGEICVKDLQLAPCAARLKRPRESRIEVLTIFLQTDIFDFSKEELDRTDSRRWLFAKWREKGCQQNGGRRVICKTGRVV